MNKRPLSVTIIGWLFVVAGAIGFVYHASEFSLHPFRSDVVLVCIVRLVAILSGVFLLRGLSGLHITLSSVPFTRFLMS